MRIAVGGDHAGFELKALLIPWLQSMGHEVEDLGAHRLDPEDDYPDFAISVGRALQDGKAKRGIVICGSGVGASVAANKLSRVRAGLCHDTYSAAQSVEHDDVNVLCLGARIVGTALATALVEAFLGAHFTGEQRHVRRLEKVNAIEASKQ